MAEKIWLSSPTMHGEELSFMTKAYETNWMSTVGENITEAERLMAQKVGVGRAVALSSGTAALHMAIRLAGEKIYGTPKNGQGTLSGQKVFCTDMTFAATVNPILYEGGEPVFIDTEYDSWNMDPQALALAFEKYPMVRMIVVVHLYGTPCKMKEILEIAREHDAVVIEDAAESLGADIGGQMTGSFGTYGCISFNGNKIITGSSGGMFLCEDEEDAAKVRKWSTQSREAAAWYQHRDLGYNYRMSNVIAGVVRGQIPYLEEHIAQKKAIYERYREAFADLPVGMNPIPKGCTPNYWLSCLLIDEEAMCAQERGEQTAEYTDEPQKSCPTQILEALEDIRAEGRPIWKPMHMQPMYAQNVFVSCGKDAGADIFARGLCLPSDNKMTVEQQETVIEAVRKNFK